MTTCYDLMTTHRVVNYYHVMTCRIISCDPVTTSRVISKNPVMTSRDISYNPVTTFRVVSYNPVMTRLSSVKELTDDSDKPTDDKWQPDMTEVMTLAKINRQKQDFFVSCLSCRSIIHVWIQKPMLAIDRNFWEYQLQCKSCLQTTITYVHI